MTHVAPLLIGLQVSENIAPEMVVIDDSSNGWRYLILPIAHEDPLVMNAVLAASAFHFASNVLGEDREFALQSYTHAIWELQKRHNLHELSADTRHFIIVAILVLLVAVMIDGCSDFPRLFCMLQSAVAANGGEDALVGGELAEFLTRQIPK